MSGSGLIVAPGGSNAVNPPPLPPELAVLQQSYHYFQRFHDNAAPRENSQLLRDASQYAALLASQKRDSLERAMLLLWQLPLGLLLALRSYPALSTAFFGRHKAMPQWYEHSFCPQIPGILHLEGAPANHKQPPQRYSPSGKKQLLFRIGGFRCSTAELLLFCSFAPLAKLLGQDGRDAPTQQVLAQLDFLLFELFQNQVGLGDLLRREYRHALHDFWQQYHNASQGAAQT